MENEIPTSHELAPSFFSRDRVTAWGFTLVVGILTLVLLSMRKYSFVQTYEVLPEWDPDVLLHLRRIDQVIGSGGAIALNGNDYFSGFPRCYQYPYSPLLDTVCIYLVWFYHALFSSSTIHYTKIVGWVPPVFGAIFCSSLFLWMRNRTGSRGLALCVWFSLCCNENFGYFFDYHLLDHHFLESFFLWTWLMMGVSFSGASEKNIFSLFLGGGLWLGLILSWSGMTRLALLITIYAALAELIEFSWSRRFAEYVSGTFLVSGALAAIIQAKSGGGFAPLVFSWFQPLFMLSLGIGLMTGRWALDQRKHKFAFGIAGICVMAILTFLWRDSFKQGFDFVTAGHPFYGTISENNSLITLFQNPESREFVNRMAWVILFAPLGFCLTWHGILKKEGQIINLVGVGIFFLSAYQIRYMRWLPFFAAIWQGNLLFEMASLIHLRVPNLSDWKRFMAGLFCLCPVFGALLFGALEVQFRGCSNAGVDFIEAMSWLQKNTPDPGGYYDSDIPKYGILNFWDMGNAIAYYGKRPPICNNLILGLDNMASIYTTYEEEEIYSKCLALKSRYWVLNGLVPDKFAKTLPQLKAGVFSNGTIPLSQPRIDWNSLPPIDENKTIFGRLFSSLGFGSTVAPGVSRFRLVYISSLIKLSQPGIKIFEIVPGAEIVGTAVPNATVTCLLRIDFPALKEKLPYWNHTISDQNGKFLLRVPYATGQKSGVVDTDDEYLFIASGSETIWKASATVSLDAVQKGLQVQLTH
ncbi:MAG: hypothetical protein HQM09_07120 [Candidatus Riflebacteria bacterium]|nr:hypothetical protein [Candidatus Riflebacteria bacterium]